MVLQLSIGLVFPCFIVVVFWIVGTGGVVSSGKKVDLRSMPW